MHSPLNGEFLIKWCDIMKKEPRGSYDVVLERKTEVCVVRWHDSKVDTLDIVI